jgi:hypothetical protein
MATKKKVEKNPLDTVLELLPELDQPDLALVEGKLAELMSGGGVSRRVKRVMEFSFCFDGKQYDLKGSANNVARSVASVIYPRLQGVRFNPVRVFTGRQTANFWKRSEFAKIVKAIQDAGGEVSSWPDSIK